MICQTYKEVSLLLANWFLVGIRGCLSTIKRIWLPSPSSVSTESRQGCSSAFCTHNLLWLLVMRGNSKELELWSPWTFLHSGNRPETLHQWLPNPIERDWSRCPPQRSALRITQRQLVIESPSRRIKSIKSKFNLIAIYSSTNWLSNVSKIIKHKGYVRKKLTQHLDCYLFEAFCPIELSEMMKIVC